MKKEGYYILGSVVGLNLLVIILYILNIFVANTKSTNVFDYFVRIFALLGLVALFISSMFTAFQKELYAAFKKPFIKIHHSTTIAGLIMITLHPVLFAIDKMISSTFVEGLKVFLPKFSSSYDFWSLAGRPALILIYIALIGVLLRNVMKKGWRWIHALNYIALVFGVVHGIIIGTDFYGFQGKIYASTLIITILFLLLTITTIVTFTLKRIQIYKIQQRKKERAAEKAET